MYTEYNLNRFANVISMVCYIVFERTNLFLDIQFVMTEAKTFMHTILGGYAINFCPAEIAEYHNFFFLRVTPACRFVLNIQRCATGVAVYNLS